MSSFAAHPRWLSSGEHNYDYAVITLARSLGAAPLGYWGSATHGVGTRLAVIEPKIIAAVDDLIALCARIAVMHLGVLGEVRPATALTEHALLMEAAEV